MKNEQTKERKPKCRCYINLKYYARAAFKGTGTMRGYKPCPVHDDIESEEDDRLKGEAKK